MDSPGNLVPEPLGWNVGDVGADPLVGVEVQGETSVVLLDDLTCNTLDGFGSYATL